MKQKGYLVLEDGDIYEGFLFGSVQAGFGEVVFNTSMTGYQEIMTDPSYAGQLVCMTYPLMGNYGATDLDMESMKPHLRGFIVKKLSEYPGNFRSSYDLSTFLTKYNIAGIEGVDTRRLTLKIRNRGAMRGGICSDKMGVEQFLSQVKASPYLGEEDLVMQVTTKEPYTWDEAGTRSGQWNEEDTCATAANLKIAVIDFGIKANILKLLRQYFKHIRVFPAHTTSQDIKQFQPDGLFLSNGPGDPEKVTYAVKTVKDLLGQVPIFGICLGHQILSLALGGKTYKLKFGHRGGNQPVKAIHRAQIEITSQNHGYAVDFESLKGHRPEVTLTHWNLNDQTVEGIRIEALKAFSVQYHPESSPGPHDSRYLFNDFLNLIQKGSVVCA